MFFKKLNNLANRDNKGKLNLIRGRLFRKSVFIGLLLIFLIDVGSQYAYGWWNSNWSYRRKITFANSGRQQFTDFPALIVLSEGSGRIDYTKTQNSGQDIRFVDSNDTTQLDHEIEKWNESGTSYAWVRVPTLDQSNTDYIYMYYGYASASDGQNKNGVWNSNYTTVWHMDGSGTTITDSTSSPTSPTLPSSWGWTASGQPANGLTWTAKDLSQGHHVGSGLNDGGDWTIEFWYNGTTSPPASGFDDYFVVTSGRWDGLTIGSFGDPAPKYIDYTDYNNGAGRDSNGTNYGNGVFDHYALRSDWDGGGAGTSRFRIYKNGVFQATFDKSNDPTPATIDLGTESDLYQVGATIDEFRISNTLRSDEWVDMTYDVMQDTVNTYGSEESSGPLRGAVIVVE